MGTVWHVLHKTLDMNKELMYIDPNDVYCHWGLFVCAF